MLRRLILLLVARRATRQSPKLSQCLSWRVKQKKDLNLARWMAILLKRIYRVDQGELHNIMTLG